MLSTHVREEARVPWRTSSDVGVLEQLRRDDVGLVSWRRELPSGLDAELTDWASRSSPELDEVLSMPNNAPLDENWRATHAQLRPLRRDARSRGARAWVADRGYRAVAGAPGALRGCSPAARLARSGSHEPVPEISCRPRSVPSCDDVRWPRHGVGPRRCGTPRGARPSTGLSVRCEQGDRPGPISGSPRGAGRSHRDEGRSPPEPPRSGSPVAADRGHWPDSSGPNREHCGSLVRAESP